MNVQTLTTEISSLLEEREGLRDDAAADPRHAKVRAMTDAIVAAKLAGQEFAKLAAERDALRDTIRSEVNALSDEISGKRRQLRAAEAAEAGAKYAKLSDDDLHAKMAQNVESRRILKRDARALRSVLNDREFRKSAKDLVAGMTPEARAVMLAELGKA